jgi:hypothetical protein
MATSWIAKKLRNDILRTCDRTNLRIRGSQRFTESKALDKLRKGKLRFRLQVRNNPKKHILRVIHLQPKDPVLKQDPTKRVPHLPAIRHNPIKILKTNRNRVQSQINKKILDRNDH